MPPPLPPPGPPPRPPPPAPPGGAAPPRAAPPPPRGAPPPPPGAPRAPPRPAAPAPSAIKRDESAAPKSTSPSPAAKAPPAKADPPARPPMPMAPKAPQLKPPSTVKPTDLKMPSNTPSKSDSKGGFDTSMLEKVANRKNKDADKDKDKDSDDNWSDEDSGPQQKRKSAIGEVSKSEVLKKASTKPPLNTKPPPTRTPIDLKKQPPTKPPGAAPPGAAPPGAAPPGAAPPGVKTSDATSAKPTTRASTDGSSESKEGTDNKASSSDAAMKSALRKSGTDGTKKRLSIFAEAAALRGGDRDSKSQNALKEALMETGKSASMKELLSANQRIHELESELHDLQKKLERTESRNSHGPESAEGLTREYQLEKELSNALEALSVQKATNRSLELTINELQRNLTMADHAKALGMDPGLDAGMDDVVTGGSRIRALEDALIKAKTEKDRAVKVLISILGAEKVESFLDRHAGSADILTVLQKHFAKRTKWDLDNPGAQGMATSGTGAPKVVGKGRGPLSGKTSHSKPAKSKGYKAGKSVPTLGAHRSRIDEFQKSSNIMGYGV